jgi:hypothetical protein
MPRAGSQQTKPAPAPRPLRNGKCGRLPRRQYRLEPLDRRLLFRALSCAHHHVEAVGLAIGDQGGVALTELRPMGVTGAEQVVSNSAIMHGLPKGTTSEYVCRLGRHRTGNGERCDHKKSLHVISR